MEKCTFLGCEPGASESSDSEESHFDQMIGALEFIGEDLPNWVKDPFGFDNVKQVKRYYKRGPHSLRRRRETFRALFKACPVVRLELGNLQEKLRVNEGYVEGVICDLLQYIDEVFDRSAKYYEHEGLSYIVVFSR